MCVMELCSNRRNNYGVVNREYEQVKNWEFHPAKATVFIRVPYEAE